MAENAKTAEGRLPIPPTVKNNDDGAREVLSVWACTGSRSFAFDVGALHPLQWGEVLANVVEGLSMAALQAGASVEGRPATRQEILDVIVGSLNCELRILDDAANKGQGQN